MMAERNDPAPGDVHAQLVQAATERIKRTQVSRHARSPSVRLYHDVDGVLFGQYGPRGSWQVRPGLSDWLYWVMTRFEVVWLTSWPQADLEQLLTHTYNQDVIPASRYLTWRGDKGGALLADVTADTKWLWIDDEPMWAEVLESLGREVSAAFP